MLLNPDDKKSTYLPKIIDEPNDTRFRDDKQKEYDDIVSKSELNHWQHQVSLYTLKLWEIALVSQSKTLELFLRSFKSVRLYKDTRISRKTTYLTTLLF